VVLPLTQRLQAAKSTLASARERDRITEALVRAAAIIAPRVGLFGVKREGLRVLAAPGSALRLTEGLVIPLPEGGPLDRAVTGQALLHLLSEPSLSFAVGQPLGIPCVFEPVLAGGRTVLMLYLDRAGVAFDTSERAAVRELCDLARQSLEALLRLLGWVVPSAPSTEPGSGDRPSRPHLSPSVTRPPEPAAPPADERAHEPGAPAAPSKSDDSGPRRSPFPGTLVARAPSEMLPPAPPPGQVPATLPDRPADEAPVADAGPAEAGDEPPDSGRPREASERPRSAARPRARQVITLVNPIRREEPSSALRSAAPREPAEPRDAGREVEATARRGAPITDEPAEPRDAERDEDATARRGAPTTDESAARRDAEREEDALAARRRAPTIEEPAAAPAVAPTAIESTAPIAGEPTDAPAEGDAFPPDSPLVARFAALAAADPDAASESRVPAPQPAAASPSSRPGPAAPPAASDRPPSRPVAVVERPPSRPVAVVERPPSRPVAVVERPPSQSQPAASQPGPELPDQNPAGLPVVDDEPAAPPTAPPRAASQPVAAASPVEAAAPPASEAAAPPAPSDLVEATGPIEPAPTDMFEAPAEAAPAAPLTEQPAAPTSTLHMPNLVAPPGTRPARRKPPEPAIEPVLVIPKSLRKQTELTAAPHPMGRRSDRDADHGAPTLSIPATLINPRSGRRRGKNEPRPEGPPTLNMPRLVRDGAPGPEAPVTAAPEAMSQETGAETPVSQAMPVEAAAPASEAIAAPAPAETATAIGDQTAAAAEPPPPSAPVDAELAPDLREPTEATELSEEEAEAAIEAYLADPADPAAMARLRALDAGGLARLAARFPGPIDLANATNFPPPSAHGPLLRACVELGPAITPHILELFASQRPQIRFYAAFLFQELRDPRCLRALGELTLDSDPDVRLIATRVLETYHRAPEFAPAAARVRAELDSRDRERQLLATEAVSTLRDTLAVPRLIDLLAVRDKHLREAALEALCSITAKHHGYRAARWRQWYAEHGSEPRILWVMDGLRHRDAAVRRWAADELVRLTGQRIPFPADADRRTRELALRAWQDWWDREGAAFTERE
jgi:HEAT repeat protein